MNKEQIVNQTAKYIKAKLTGEGSGHDWWHVYRVWKNAIHIGKHEKVNLFVVELAAMLHDIADWKFNNGNDKVGSQLAKEWLEKLSVDKNVISHVCQIIKDASFKGAGVKINMKTTEGMVVQGADRLDAIGAMESAGPLPMAEKSATRFMTRKNRQNNINRLMTTKIWRCFHGESFL